jgi:hypothetical protein
MRQATKIGGARHRARRGGGARRVALGALGAGALVGLAPAAASAAAGAAPGHAPSPELSGLSQVKLYPLAGTGVDPLSNVIGTNLSGLPVSTAPVSTVFADGLPLRDLPALGSLFGPASGEAGS